MPRCASRSRWTRPASRALPSIYPRRNPWRNFSAPLACRARPTYRPYRVTDMRLAYLRASLAIAREFRRQRVDLVHCADLLAAHHAGLAGWLARVPVLCHIRNRFDAMSRRDCSFLWPVQRFVFVSRNTWRHFACRVAPSRGAVVYDGIDVLPARNRRR